jgi:hypothetical protein
MHWNFCLLPSPLPSDGLSTLLPVSGANIRLSLSKTILRGFIFRFQRQTTLRLLMACSTGPGRNKHGLKRDKHRHSRGSI